MKINVNDCFPDVTFFQLVEGNPKAFKTAEIFNEKKIKSLKRLIKSLIPTKKMLG